ncbi:starch binding domain-containing protein [Mycena maculata]|uniref:Starch binding domain-containing protein n=1 Tax=Mycena maculata TaxID=230809 RepID=A0AAD7NL95_9AGAR|nr:starch binding domain-containing protein [Mycena maculata]
MLAYQLGHPQHELKSQISVEEPTDPSVLGRGTDVTVQLRISIFTFAANIFLVGNISQLGTWDPASSLPLSAGTYPIWTITVNLPPNTIFQYKFIRKKTDGSVVWESGPNRSATTNASGSQTIESMLWL